MASDAQGRLWLGTENGGAFWNGRGWTSFHMPERKATDYVNAVAGTSDGSVWFGTRGGGIHRRKGETWTSYRQAEGLPGATVLCLREVQEPGGALRLYAGLEPGLARWEGDRWIPVSLPPELAGTGIHALVGEPEGTLWVGSMGGLACLRDGSWKRFQPGEGPGMDPVFSLLKSGDALWVGTGKGVFRYVAGVWTHFRPQMEVPSGKVMALAETVAPSGSKTLWAGTYGGGLACYSNERWRILGKTESLAEGLVVSLLPSPGPGPTASLWVGTAGNGLVRLDPGGWSTFDEALGLRGKVVFSFAETGGAFFVATGDGGLTRITSAGEVASVPLPTPSPISLWGFGRDVWVGTSQGFIHRVDASNGRLLRTFGPRDGLPAYPIRGLMVTSRGVGQEVLWAASIGGGLLRWEHGRWRILRKADGLPDDRVRALCASSGESLNRIYVGTASGVVFADLDDGEGRLRPLPTALPRVAVNHLLEERVGTKTFLWVGTRDQGLFRVPVDDPSVPILHFDESSDPALPSDTVNRVERDARGRIYATTHRGIVRLDPPSKEATGTGAFAVRLYTVGDGLPSQESNAGASLKDSAGRIWVGTVAGATVLDPAREVETTAAPPLVLERIRAGNRVGPGPGDLLKLRHGENHLVFEYALLGTYRAEDAQFKAQLVGAGGVEATWNSETRREYPALPPGSYAFRLQGRDHAGHLTPTIEVPFRIHPPLWWSWWAWTAYMAFGGGSLAGLVQWNLRRLKRRNTALERLVAERTQEVSHMNTALLLAKEEVEQASRYKSTFLASMSHELRTPLNAILLYSELLSEDARDSGNTGKAQDLDRIRASGQHLLKLINGILDLSKIEAGKMTLYPEDVELPALLADVTGTLQPMVEAKGNRIEVTLEPGLQVIHTDLTKLRQVLYNLISNACKFTEKGVIFLEVERAGESVLFHVRDTGIGMTPEQLGRLFQDFMQAEVTTTKHYGGTGLGLTISRRICELMGGRITVESESGMGTTFTVRLPLVVCETLPPDAESSAPSAENRKSVALVIDDDAVLRDYLTRTLAKEGLWVASASGGAEGLHLARKLHPHTIILDVVMEGMDGWDVLAELKRDPQLKDIPVVLLSVLEDEEKGFALGATEYIQKPVRGEDLAPILRRLQGDRRVHVLVVEDDESTRSALTALLVRQGMDAWSAGDAAEALARLNEGRPDLILLDLLLPGMDGFALAERLSRHPEWKDIPVVVLTSKDLSPEEQARLYAAQAGRVLRKGAHSKQELADIVQSMVQSGFHSPPGG